MARDKELSEFQFGTSDQDNFYESSVRWVNSLKDRHDHHGHMGILENDLGKYPFQALENVIVPSYQPAPQEIADAGGADKIQEYILAKTEADSDGIMGAGYFNTFINDLLAAQSLPEIKSRLAKPNQNCATVAFHANIMALPIYAAAIPRAFNDMAKAESSEFDMFEFSKQNVLPINPALAVASFKGEPVIERLTKFATVSKIPPPTRSNRSYGLDRAVLKSMARKSKEASTNYLQQLHQQGKSALLTIDPTAATFESKVDENGNLLSLRRNPVNRGAEAMILKDFGFVWPMTMMLWGNRSSWYLGEAHELDHDGSFGAVISDLDHQTERLSRVKMLIGHPDRIIGKLALGTNPI